MIGNLNNKTARKEITSLHIIKTISTLMDFNFFRPIYPLMIINHSSIAAANMKNNFLITTV